MWHWHALATMFRALLLISTLMHRTMDLVASQKCSHEWIIDPLNLLTSTKPYLYFDSYSLCVFLSLLPFFSALAGFSSCIKTWNIRLCGAFLQNHIMYVPPPSENQHSLLTLLNYVYRLPQCSPKFGLWNNKSLPCDYLWQPVTTLTTSREWTVPALHLLTVAVLFNLNAPAEARMQNMCNMYATYVQCVCKRYAICTVETWFSVTSTVKQGDWTLCWMASQHFGTFPRAFFETVLAAILRREVAHLVQRTTEERKVAKASEGIRRQNAVLLFGLLQNMSGRRVTRLKRDSGLSCTPCMTLFRDRSPQLSLFIDTIMKTSLHKTVFEIVSWNYTAYLY